MDPKEILRVVFVLVQRALGETLWAKNGTWAWQDSGKIFVQLYRACWTIWGALRKSSWKGASEEPLSGMIQERSKPSGVFCLFAFCFSFLTDCVSEVKAFGLLVAGKMGRGRKHLVVWLSGNAGENQRYRCQRQLWIRLSRMEVAGWGEARAPKTEGWLSSLVPFTLLTTVVASHIHASPDCRNGVPWSEQSKPSVSCRDGRTHLGLWTGLPNVPHAASLLLSPWLMREGDWRGEGGGGEGLSCSKMGLMQHISPMKSKS